MVAKYVVTWTISSAWSEDVVCEAHSCNHAVSTSRAQLLTERGKVAARQFKRRVRSLGQAANRAVLSGFDNQAARVSLIVVKDGIRKVGRCAPPCRSFADSTVFGIGTTLYRAPIAIFLERFIH